jgi:decaprenylphospho-beta-D-erythro-pentofuranosid-2-ulose 2-reductase
VSPAHKKRIVVLGALSAVGQAAARLWAAEGARLLLVGRSPERLSQVAQDLRARGAAECRTLCMDLAAVVDAPAEIERIASMTSGPIDAILICYGVLGDQSLAEKEFDKARAILDVNFVSAAAWSMAVADQFEKQGGGVLVVLCSVAGDRGRQSNYIYGAAKGGLTILVQGLAHRLARTKARAVAIKLGMVDTPMTAHMPKGGALWSTPEQVARRIKSVVDRGAGPVVYVPSYWRWIMSVIRAMPAPLFHKTRL